MAADKNQFGMFNEQDGQANTMNGLMLKIVTLTEPVGSGGRESVRSSEVISSNFEIHIFLEKETCHEQISN